MAYNDTKTNKNGIVRDESNTTKIWAEDWNEWVTDYLDDKDRIDGIVDDVKYTNANGSPITVGGIEEGVTFNNVTFNEFVDLLLYPELFPTLIEPSSTFLLSQQGLREFGTVITLNFSSTFNRGSIIPSYNTTGFRSGLPNTYVYTGTGLSDVNSALLTNSVNVSNYTVVLGTQSWTGRVSYDGGEQPLSSKGNDYSTPLAEGQTNVITRTITGVFPYYATTSTISTPSKQSLASHGSIVTTNLLAETGGDKQSVEFPEAWGNITQLEQYNTLSGNWDSVDLSTFTITTITKNINGSTINYKKYTHNGSTIGARNMRWTV